MSPCEITAKVPCERTPHDGTSELDHACAPARRRPPALKDAAGNPLRTGQTVTDDTLGDCIVRGTVPLDKGDRRRSSLASSSTFAGSRRTVGPWVPSLTRLPLRRRVSSRNTNSRSSTLTAQQDLPTSLSRTTLPALDCAVRLVVPVARRMRLL